MDQSFLIGILRPEPGVGYWRLLGNPHVVVPLSLPMELLSSFVLLHLRKLPLRGLQNHSLMACLSDTVVLL